MNKIGQALLASFQFIVLIVFIVGGIYLNIYYENILLSFKEIRSLYRLKNETCVYDGYYIGEMFTCLGNKVPVLEFSCSNGDLLFFVESNASKLIDWCNGNWGAQCDSFQHFINSCDNPTDVRYYISGNGWDKR